MEKNTITPRHINQPIQSTVYEIHVFSIPRDESENDSTISMDAGIMEWYPNIHSFSNRNF